MSSTEPSPPLETPFITTESGSDLDFWRSYVAARPSPPNEFFRFIISYHTGHGESRTAVAHDVGTGPGNIAAKLAPYFEHVVGSDVNERALASAPALVPAEFFGRITFITTPAEELANGVLPENIGPGKTDVITVSECMPMLDPPRALQAFHALLRPGGTLAIYFYGRPIFTDGNEAVCNALYGRLATRVCTFLHPFKGTPGFALHARAAEALISSLDNIAVPSEDWEHVERHKWNCHDSILFNSKDGYDFEVEPVDRRTEGEKTVDVADSEFWAEEWDIERVEAYLDSVYPNYRKRAGDRYAELKDMIEELQEAMGGRDAKRKVTFPVSLILATRK
jgi:SAM-dependent methyltransferase